MEDDNFGSQLVYNKKFFKAKIKSHGDKLQVFTVRKFLDSNHTCLAVISLDSALKKYEHYYLLVLLKERKYVEKKVVRNINDNLSDFLLPMSLIKNRCF